MRMTLSLRSLLLAAALVTSSPRPTSASSTRASSIRTARRCSTSPSRISSSAKTARRARFCASRATTIRCRSRCSSTTACRCGPGCRCCARRSRRSSTRRAKTCSSRSSRSRSARPIVVGYTTDRAALRKAADSMFAYEAANYLLDGIAETSQGLAKRTMWRSAIAVITGVGPEMSYRQYTEVLRFFRAGGASLHVVQVGTRHRRTGARDCRQQGHVRNRGPLRRSAAADRPRAEIAAARDRAVESVSRDLRATEPARAAVKDRSQRAAHRSPRPRHAAEDGQIGSGLTCRTWNGTSTS